MPHDEETDRETMSVRPPQNLDLEKANERLSELLEEGEMDRNEIARAALSISPLCADAYNVMAMEHQYSDPRKALKLWKKALSVAKKACGPEFLNDIINSDDDFWDYEETHPYLRAKIGLAEAYLDLEADDDAIAELVDVLVLNPSDAMGIRYRLFMMLIESGNEMLMANARKLVDAYEDDDSSMWAWNRALASIALGEDDAMQLLSNAMGSNPHVPHFLLNPDAMPHIEGVVTVTDDSPEQAMLYAGLMYDAWMSVPAAMKGVENMNALMTPRENMPSAAMH